MKFFAPIVVGFIASFSAQVDANGVCYDPDHVSGKNDATVQADMKTIAGAGFSSVRTYISKFGNTEMGPIIAAAGLTAVLGVPYPQSDYQEQMESAIKACNAGGVSIIMVGNENLAGVSSVPSGMIDVINQIKSRASCKVGTVQRNTEVIGYQSISGWSELVAACDVLGVNVHPFFNPGTTADGAIDVVDKQWKTMMSSFGDKLLLTETGWPSSGSVSGNTGSLSGEQTFYSAYQQWSSGLSEKFYFQFFDTPGKSSAYEQTFGLYTADSQSKFTMSQSPSTSTSQQQQQTTSAPTTSAPTTAAPAPTTAAPTPEPTTATPQPTTAAPTPAPETYQSSGSSETNTTSSSIASASGSDASVQQGFASFSGSDSDVKVSSSSSSKTSSSTEQDETKTDSKSGKTTSETTTSPVSSIGKSSESEQQQQQQQASGNGDDNTQSANTQSEGSSSTGVVGFALAGGGCAMLVAFGFIYQARKRAQELEEEDKDVHFSTVTPVENICSL